MLIRTNPVNISLEPKGGEIKHPTKLGFHSRKNYRDMIKIRPLLKTSYSLDLEKLFTHLGFHINKEIINYSLKKKNNNLVKKVCYPNTTETSYYSHPYKAPNHSKANKNVLGSTWIPNIVSSKRFVTFPCDNTLGCVEREI